ncbi:MAG: CoA synthetase [Proteobacteria bacterium]|nr:CoA synthetase [Pseudomonadota bacterium]
MAAGPAALSLDALVAAIADGASLAIPADYSGVPMAATRALMRRGSKGLRLITVPQAGLQADLLIGAGMVASIETAAVTLGELGLAPAFTRWAQSGRLRVIDSTCPAIHAGLQAAEKGIPFMALRGLIGTDILRHRPDWTLSQNPFAADDPIVLLPAIQPDVALFHASMADLEGNVWIGRRRELATMAHASRTTLVTVERRYEGSFFDDERLAAGTMPALYVDSIALARHGAWPVGLTDEYPADTEHLRAYAAEAASEAGFQAYLAREVFGRAAAAE